MKKLIFILIALLAATWIGVKISADPGYVLFSYAGWTMEMPLWVFAILFLLLLLTGYFILRALHGLRVSGKTWRRWRSQRQLKQTQQYLMQGMLAVAEGDLAAAEAAFNKAAKVSPQSASSLLLLSNMALQQNQPERAENFINKADQLLPKAKQSRAKLAIAFNKAKLLATNARDKAIEQIQALRQQHPKQKALVQFLFEHYRAAGWWREFIDLLPTALKLGVIDKATYKSEQRDAYEGLMQSHQQRGEWHAMHALWLEMPRHLHQDVELFIAYCQALCATDNSDTAEKLLRREIKKHYDPQLVNCYGSLAGVDKGQLLAQAEKWVHKHPDDADLLTVLGQLCIDCRLWGKARDYLERAMATRMDRQVCHGLGLVLEQFKEDRAAMDIYRQGLSLPE